MHDKAKVIWSDGRQSKVRALRAGEVVEFDGLMLRMVQGKEFGDDLLPGDTYFAERNTQNLLTVRDVHRDNSLVGGWVNPVEMAYPFDCGECVGVELVED